MEKNLISLVDVVIVNTNTIPVEAPLSVFSLFLNIRTLKICYYFDTNSLLCNEIAAPPISVGGAYLCYTIPNYALISL